LCVGRTNVWDECICSASHVTARRTRVCSGCGAPMILIDFATGEPVARRVVA
jgi:hypothetical protein